MTRQELAPIFRVITARRLRSPRRKSYEELPARYAITPDRTKAWLDIIQESLRYNLISKNHHASMRAVIRSWDRQPALVRSMAFGALDLLSMVNEEERHIRISEDERIRNTLL